MIGILFLGRLMKSTLSFFFTHGNSQEPPPYSTARQILTLVLTCATMRTFRTGYGRGLSPPWLYCYHVNILYRVWVHRGLPALVLALARLANKDSVLS